MPRQFKVTVNGREYEVSVLELTVGQAAPAAAPVTGCRRLVSPIMAKAREVVRSGRTVSVVRADVSCGDGWVMEPCGLLQATMLRVSG